VNPQLTSRDIARLAEVSQATVSRVLNNKGNVSEETRRRVLEIVRTQNYSLNETARSLIKGRANAIGVVVEDILNPFYPELVSELSEVVYRAGYHLLLWKADVDSAEEHLKALRSRLVDGMVFTAAQLDSAAVHDLSAQGFPIVLANRTVDDSQCDMVSLDNAEAGRMAAGHLLEIGARRIAVVGGNPNTSTYRDRSHGLRAAFRGAGLDDGDYFFVPGAYDYRSGHDAAMAILRSRADVTAVVGMNDIVAIGALNAAQTLGRAVPDQLAVVGFDNIAMADWPLIQLTTVSSQMSLASSAIDLLLTRVNHPGGPPRQLTISPRLYVRRTTSRRPVGQGG
jgi:LacI family transcriptional regulator